MKDKKKFFGSIIIILLIILVFIMEFTIGDQINTAFKDEKIHYTSQKYEYIMSSDHLNDLSKYQLLVSNNQIYFYNKKTEEIVKDNAEVLKKVWYKENSCDKYKEANGENLKCEKTYDFFELYMCDTANLLVVDKDGRIFHNEFEYDSHKKTGKYDFYGNYWYGNIKISQESNNNEIYIQEVYKSEGTPEINVIHKDDDGKLNGLYRIDDFYFTEDNKYMELAYNELTIYQDKKVIKKINNYDHIYDIYEGKYLLVKDSNYLKLNNLNNQTIVNFGRISSKYNYLKVEEDDDVLYIFDEKLGYRIYSFDIQGNIEYLDGQTTKQKAREI